MPTGGSNDARLPVAEERRHGPVNVAQQSDVGNIWSIPDFNECVPRWKPGERVNFTWRRRTAPLKVGGTTARFSPGRSSSATGVLGDDDGSFLDDLTAVILLLRALCYEGQRRGATLLQTRSSIRVGDVIEFSVFGQQIIGRSLTTSSHRWVNLSG